MEEKEVAYGHRNRGETHCNKTLDREYPGRSRWVPMVTDIEERIQRFNKTLDTEYPDRSR